MFDLDGIEALPPIRPLIITMEVRPEEVELALATNGNSLRRAFMLALIATMAVETGEIA